MCNFSVVSSHPSMSRDDSIRGSKDSNTLSSCTTSHVKLELCHMIEELYDIQNKIGEGTFGHVYKVSCRSTNKAMAMKKISKDKLSGGTHAKSWEREIHVLRSVSHENIVEVHAILESPNYVFMVMELCAAGTLADKINQRGFNGFSEEITLIYMKQLGSAVAYLHKKSIVHRDIKPENLLMANDKVLKLSDFGLSIELRKTEDTLLEFCGTPMYMAPEILIGNSYSRQCDVWSMGLIFYILIMGMPPFKSRNEASLYEEIRAFDIKKSISFTSKISGAAKSCLEDLLNADPLHRISALEFLDSAWVKGVDIPSGSSTNVLQLMKEFNMSNRTNSTGALDSFLKPSDSKESSVSSNPAEKDSSNNSMSLSNKTVNKIKLSNTVSTIQQRNKAFKSTSGIPTSSSVAAKTNGVADRSSRLTKFNSSNNIACNK